MKSDDETKPEDRVPPRGLGLFFVIGSPIFVLVVAVWYWSDGLASILLYSWFMSVTFIFGVTILRSTPTGRSPRGG